MVGLDEAKRITILFGGLNKERLVSVASAQALHRALPDADLWFWDADDQVYPVKSAILLGHAVPSRTLSIRRAKALAG